MASRNSLCVFSDCLFYFILFARCGVAREDCVYERAGKANDFLQAYLAQFTDIVAGARRRLRAEGQEAVDDCCLAWKAARPDVYGTFGLSPKIYHFGPIVVPMMVQLPTGMSYLFG